MRLPIRTLTPVLAAIFTITGTPAFAQDASVAGPPADPIVSGGDTVSVAVGVATLPSYEGSGKNRLIPGAVIRGTLSGINFSTRGAQLFVDVVPGGNGPTWDFQLGPVVGLNFDRTSLKTIDNPRVEALGKRKTAIEVGGYTGIGKTGVITSDYDKMTLSVSYVHDVNNAHKSYIITPQLDYGTPLSRKAYVGLSANASYIGNGYAQTYFSVDGPGALASTLPVFSARKGWKNYSLSGFATYSLTGDLLHGLSILAGGSYSRLLGDSAYSPVTRITGDRDQWIGAVGLGYTF